MVVSHTSSPSSPIGGRRLIPAQLTRMSGSPNLPAASSAAARTPSRVPRSALTQAARQPSAVSSSTVAASCASLRATTTTLAPARASAPLMARPMPELPPVTTATRPSSENSSERYACEVMSAA
ncbi:hypothetical protein BEK98_15860 [Streptomyces diastatochromogenes]|uniref:Uncharacterized protein n=1 Tax=Streptomyces diastatochromogenes TaxID=42236 RepID=A0A233SIZ6_STRDA|nr:hypothetical protein BEK98_15860 [Streptomyces diastatochromogenes]